MSTVLYIILGIIITIAVGFLLARINSGGNYGR